VMREATPIAKRASLIVSHLPARAGLTSSHAVASERNPAAAAATVIVREDELARASDSWSRPMEHSEAPRPVVASPPVRTMSRTAATALSCERRITGVLEHM
jgi:hypothetical protein